MIDIQNLVYEYPGKKALDDISFHIPQGSITALVGPNGAGKTTLLRCIAALHEPFSGVIRVGGINVAEHPRQAHKMLGYLSDFFGLYDDLTVRQCLIFIARSHQTPEAKIAQQVQWAAKLLELESYLDKKAGTLSRGWRQRLGIAQAIIHNPRLLLLDEPASGLDPEARVALSSLLRSLRDQGMTLVVSSHILAELEDYCTDMLVLRDGKVTEYRSSVSKKADTCQVEAVLLESADDYAQKLKALASVSQLSVNGQTIHFVFSGTEEARALILKDLITSGAMVSSFSAQRVRLQDIYLSLSKQGKPN